MSRLRIFAEHTPTHADFSSNDHAVIAAQLADVGIRFEQWTAATPIADGATADNVIAAYRADIDRLLAERGYQAFDVISLHPQHPDREQLRAKFLNEHTHAEDEVRFFVAGSGLFTLHLGERVFEVLCERGDLIGVPAGTRHWFDMGAAPRFTAIRIFTNPAGWVANFTGESIAERFPRYEPQAA
ncbi:MAG: 1,2-dihydroxy-3-keto-5-methylthiopentene dioxygenase [Pseudomarimonas sp.]